MRPNLHAAVWVLAALCGACGSRAVPGGMGGQGHLGGGAGGAGAGGAGGGSAGGVAGSLAGTTGGAGRGGAGATTGGAGAGAGGGVSGSAGGAAGAGGATPVVGDCPLGTATGQPCVIGSFCTNVMCSACSDQYWSLVRSLVPCSCSTTGVWSCPMIGRSGDCFFDPPLDCALAQLLYEDATCQTHPPCSAGN
jgi:hypothetical protein